MKLITAVVLKTLLKNAAATIADPERDTMQDKTVKFFNPCGAATWFFSEAEQIPASENYNGRDDLRLFGWCDLGLGAGCAELGYVMLSELQGIRLMGGLGIERDMWHEGTLGEAVNSG